jgi:hypothetical protein
VAGDADVTAPTPAVFEEQCAMVVMMLKELQQEYRWAHGVAHSPAVGDDVKVATGSPSDPTATVLLSKRSARRSLEDAAQALTKCEKLVNGSLGSLSKALRLVDPTPRFEPLRYKADATRADIAEARQAQARRYARGEGVPE